jgi:hypothetical protein
LHERLKYRELLVSHLPVRLFANPQALTKEGVFSRLPNQRDSPKPMRAKTSWRDPICSTGAMFDIPTPIQSQSGLNCKRIVHRDHFFIAAYMTTLFVLGAIPPSKGTSQRPARPFGGDIRAKLGFMLFPKFFMQNRIGIGLHEIHV